MCLPRHNRKAFISTTLAKIACLVSLWYLQNQSVILNMSEQKTWAIDHIWLDNSRKLTMPILTSYLGQNRYMAHLFKHFQISALILQIALTFKTDHSGKLYCRKSLSNVPWQTHNYGPLQSLYETNFCHAKLTKSIKLWQKSS